MRGKLKKGNTVQQYGVLLVVVMALFIVGLHGKAVAEEEVIKIGAIYPFSGQLAVLGNEAFFGADAARQYINEKGGVWGKKVEFIKVDAPTPSIASNEARRLINKEKIKVIFGTYGSSISLAASQVAEKNNVVWWEMGSWAIQITGRGFKNVYRIGDNSKTIGLTMANFAAYLSKLLGKKVEDLQVALVHEDSAAGTAVIEDTARKQLENLGVKITGIHNYNAKTGDLTPLILKLKSSNPDVVLQQSYLNDSILYWKQARELNFKPKVQVFGAGVILMNDFIKAQKKYLNGLFDVGASQLQPEALAPELRELANEFIKRWRAFKGGETSPPGHAVRGFSNAYVFLKYVLPKAGSLDHSKIREAIMSLDMPHGSTLLGWGVKFAPNGQNQRVFAHVRQWQNGKTHLVWPKELATHEPTGIPLAPWE